MTPSRIRQPNHYPRVVANVVAVSGDKVLLGIRKNPFFLRHDLDVDPGFLHGDVGSSPTFTFADEAVRLPPVLPEYGSGVLIPGMPAARLNAGAASSRQLASMFAVHVLERTCDLEKLTDGHTVTGEAQQIHVRHGFVPEVDGMGNVDWARGGDYAMLTVLVRIDSGAEHFVGDRPAYANLDWVPVRDALARVEGRKDSLRMGGRDVRNYFGGFCMDAVVDVLEFAQRDSRTILGRSLGARSLAPDVTPVGRFDGCKALVLCNVDGVGGLPDRMYQQTLEGFQEKHGALAIANDRGKGERPLIRIALGPAYGGPDLVPDAEVARVQDWLEVLGVQLVRGDSGLVVPVTSMGQPLATIGHRQLGVVTENSRPMAETLLDALHIRPYAMRTRSEVALGHETTLTSMVRQVCAELGVPPEKTVVVGKTARALTAASELGAMTIAMGEIVGGHVPVGLHVGRSQSLHLQRETADTFSIGAA